jgi:hypothetical protein
LSVSGSGGIVIRRGQSCLRRHYLTRTPISRVPIDGENEGAPEQRRGGPCGGHGAPGGSLRLLERRGYRPAAARGTLPTRAATRPQIAQAPRCRRSRGSARNTGVSDSASCGIRTVSPASTPYSNRSRSPCVSDEMCEPCGLMHREGAAASGECRRRAARHVAVPRGLSPLP